MKKIYKNIILSLSLSIAVVSAGFAQTATWGSKDALPGLQQTSSFAGSSSVNAMWDIQLQFTEAVVPTVQLAGICNTGTEIWCSVWARPVIHRFDYTGTFIDSFTVAGIATGGVRAMTFDGTSVWCSYNGTDIKSIDPLTQAVTATVSHPPLTGAQTTSRWITYDHTADGGLGGFWIGNFNTDWMQISMSGAQLNSILSAQHTLTGVYGVTFEDINGTPYLWANSQTDPIGGTATGAFITQYDINAGAITGVVHDMEQDFGAPGGIAGGICATQLPGFAQPCFLANDQGVSNAAYENTLLGLKKIDWNLKLNVAPNPSNNGEIKITFVPATKENITISVLDLNGKLIYEESLNNVVNLSKSIAVNDAKGVYTVNIITEGGEKISKKVVAQ